VQVLYKAHSYTVSLYLKTESVVLGTFCLNFQTNLNYSTAAYRVCDKEGNFSNTIMFDTSLNMSVCSEKRGCKNNF
jgi:hypothetical protein